MSTDLDQHDDELDVAVADQTEPGEDTFWQLHSPRFEMPISYVSSALIMAGILALILAISYLSNTGPKQDPVPIALANDGTDDSGEGSEGLGGQENPITLGASAPTPEDFESLPHPELIPEIKKELEERLKIDDPDSVVPLTTEKVAPYTTFDKKVRDTLLNPGSKRGTPGGDGSGTDNKGSGVGGKGADSTRQRSMRWTMQFVTSSGRDYLNQLATLKAVIVVPIPPDGKTAYVFKDLINPKPGNFVEEKEWMKLAGQIQFCDFRKQSVTEVSAALNMNFTPASFFAFFPRDLEAELSRLEVAYGNKQADQIEETKFEVTVRGGVSKIVVVSQKLKR